MTPAPASTRGQARQAFRRSPWRRASRWVLASVSALAAAALATHHPLSPSAASLFAVLLAGLSFARPLAGLCLLPVLLPGVDLMPWTGWISFEEMDIALLAVAAGGHARLALAPEMPRGPAGAAPLKGLVLAIYIAALLVSMWLGLADAGGLKFGWWQGYAEAMNVLRVGKSFFLALLLYPLWRSLLRAEPERAPAQLKLGLAGGLAVTALLALWERLAFTGLADFSSDYRITALFWEMHVGGAALDGFLALTMPFAVLQLREAPSHWRWALAAGAVMLGAYACLVTFSRGVYLAVPIGVALALAIQGRQGEMAAASARDAGGWRAAAFACLFFALLAVLLFPGAGYRGLLAGWGCVCLGLPMARWWRALPRGAWAGGVVLGLLAALVLAMGGWLLPKGPYIAYGLAWLGGAGWLLRAQLRPARAGETGAGAGMLAAFVACVVLVPWVAEHWGGSDGLRGGLLALPLLLAAGLWGGRGVAARWPEALRWQGGVAAAMAITGLMVGVLLGGAYMGQRFSTGGKDLEGRQHHWSHGLALLRGPLAWAFGKGVGRFPADVRLTGDPQERTGDYRVLPHPGGQHLWLSAGGHELGNGELLRVSQRIAPFTGPVTVHAELRVPADVGLHVEICEKHLLYPMDCRVAQFDVKGSPGQWRPVTVQLPGAGLDPGARWAPRFLVFSMAVLWQGRSVDIARLRAVDATGRELLVNGDFADGMSHWFFTSDRYHLPWHMKNLALHLLFEQGLAGLLSMAALTAGVLWRVTFGHARRHPMAAPLAGALLGFGVVGAFDSLLDVPRLAWLFYLLLLVALTLPAAGTSRARP